MKFIINITVLNIGSLATVHMLLIYLSWVAYWSKSFPFLIILGNAS